VEVALNVEMNSLREKLGDSIRNLETATKEKNTARLKNKETLAKEQNQVQSFK
jgi:regulator of replication initiation timing